MIRVGIVGCGKVADKHAGQIQRVKGSKIVGVCDQEPLMAGQLAERFGVPRSFSTVSDLLSESRPDVVHITAPPQAHFSLAKQCLEAGCHVYVEKPFSLNSEEAEELIALATKVKRKVTVGHETQFMPVAMDLRRLVEKGYLGGEPIHMESIYCYEFNDERYARVLLGDQNHWIRRLPGGLLQNIISHGIGKIVEYLPDEEVRVWAHGFTSRFLESIGETTIIDELRVTILDARKTTAYFTFSSQIGPALHQFRIYGPKNSLAADFEHQTLTRIPQKRYKSYLNQFIPPFKIARQYRKYGWLNIKRFLRREFHTESGMHTLISLFYRSIEEDTPLPIPYRDILLTANIMDKVFGQLQNRQPNTRAVTSPQRQGLK